MSELYNLISKTDPRLHQKSIPFEYDDPFAWEALRAAEKILDLKKGAVGIALPQIGMMKRAFIIKWAGKKRICINPQILNKSGKLIADGEGCLSFPNFRKVMKRWTQLKVQYMTELGEVFEGTLINFEARIFAHEFDHLEGRTIG